MKLLSIVGARPNFVKIAPFLKALSEFQDIKHILVHTGQHYDYNMSKVFFRELNIPAPKIHLGIGSGTHACQTGKIMIELEKVVLAEKPDIIIVVGDVNSTIAAALVASKLCIPLAHIEAGLRSFDRTMPEEINRVVTDSLSELLFVPSDNAISNLVAEGVKRDKIYKVGNIMIDAIAQYLPLAKESNITRKFNLRSKHYGLITLHRAGNVDNKNILKGWVDSFVKISKEINLVFPVHPRTQKQLKAFGLYKALSNAKNIKLIEPIGYIESISLIMNAKFVMTDSGGVQEETTFLGIPCLTLRDETEWTETLKQGTNKLTKTPAELLKRALAIIHAKKENRNSKKPYGWDGKTSIRIINILKKYYKRS
jgi:UDP-N-acetylglucosamine 2-epimerase (non-hydrolysing)